MSLAEVRLWGRLIGAVSWDRDRQLGFFEYDKAFASSGIEVAPLTMPLSQRIYSFPALARETFHGLPGLLADSLPDKFGNTLIDAWLTRQGRRPGDFNPVERLCYTGRRGMGALEFYPGLGPGEGEGGPLEVESLVALASEILARREGLDVTWDASAESREKAMQSILKVGTSAGGARAKAVIAWNTETGEIRSGQVKAGPGFSYWILKFDGIGSNRDKEMNDPLGFGRVEYAYHRMAIAAGISMSECRLLHENGRSHFVARRFDRDAEGRKLHMQSLGAMAHFDFNLPGAYGYEQTMRVIRRLGMPVEAVEEQFRRMAFNIIARNHDDHVKNIAFLMDKAGTWRLSPAYDMTYSYNPQGRWTGSHQMTLNGKRDGFDISDFMACGETLSLRKGMALGIVAQVREAVGRWREFADEAGVGEEMAEAIAGAHRMEIQP